MGNTGVVEVTTVGSCRAWTQRCVLAEAAVARVVERSYKSTCPTCRCRLLQCGLNDTYLVATPQERFIARVYGRRWRSKADIEFETDVLRHLFAKGVAVSIPVPTDEGGWITTIPAPEGERHLMMFEYAKGGALTWTCDAHRVLAGRVAAEIHLASEDFQPSVQRRGMGLDVLVDRSRDVLRPYFAHREQDWQFLEELILVLGARIESLMSRGLDWGLCHGDLSGRHNIHIDEDGRTTIFDFDLCGFGWRAFDIAQFQWISTGLGPAAWDDFLRGYTNVRPLSDGDYASVPVFFALSHIAVLARYAWNVPDWGTMAMDDGRLGFELEFLRQWAARYGEGLETIDKTITRGVAGSQLEERSSAAGASARSEREDDALDRGISDTRSGAEEGEIAPIAHSTPRACAVLEETRSFYSLAASCTCRLLAPGLDSHYLAQDGSDVLLVRVYQANNRPTAEIECELNLQRHLAMHGVKVAEPLLGSDGRLLHDLSAPEGTRQFAVFAIPNGRPPNWMDLDNAAFLGEMAAQIHRGSRDFPETDAVPSLDAELLIASSMSAIRPVFDERGWDCDLLASVAGKLEQGLEDLPLAELEWGVCHGELNNTWNFLLSIEKDLHVVNFGQFGLSWTAYDLALCRQLSDDYGDPRIWARFVTGYRSHRDLPDLEWCAAPFFQGICVLRRLGRRAIESRLMGESMFDRRFVEAEIEALSQWDRHYSEVEAM